MATDSKETSSKPASELRRVLRVGDLVSLSVSSVGPLFSVAATGGVMAAQAGWWTLPAIGIIAIPFIISGFVFRLLNRHFPHAGASYHWSARVIGRTASHFQAWILILAYFLSIPPIIVPASSYTIALIAPHMTPSPVLRIIVSAFWVLFALLPLLLGSMPTARVTQVFLIIELASFLLLSILGVENWHRLRVPIHFGPLPFKGIMIVAVVAATILDGWEIDSYASEESRRPKVDPGLGGIIGAFLALAFYAVLYPLMLGETPLSHLANSSNPLAVWGERLVPGNPWVIGIPVLASTAGGLWLTSFILIRALYAMGREKLVPQIFSRLSSRDVPQTATIIVLIGAFGVTVMQVLFSSLGSFFSLILASAGFFLVAEFFIDTITASVFLTVGHKRMPEGQFQKHEHRILRIGAIFSAITFGFFLVAFLIVGPKAIGSAIDFVILFLVILGIVFTIKTNHSKAVFIFNSDLLPVEPEKQPQQQVLS